MHYRYQRIAASFALLMLASACAVPTSSIPSSKESSSAMWTRRPFPTVQISSPAQIAVLDANGDERPDIFVADSHGHDVLFTQRSDGGWDQATLNGERGKIGGVFVTDLNNDFAPDLVLVRNGALHLLLNDGKGHFRDATPASFGEAGSTVGAAIGDVNGDGWIDIYELRQGAPNRLWLHDAKSGNQPMFHEASEKAGIDAIHANLASLIDLDNDGYVDLLTAGRDGIEIWRNDGQGHFSREDIDPRHNQWTTVAATDYNNDGLLDVFVGATGGGVLLTNQGRFHFAVKNISHPAVTAAWLNIDNSDHPTLLVETENGKTRAFTPPVFTDRQSGAWQLAATEIVETIDLNRDGLADLITRDAGGYVQLWTNQTRGHHWLGVRLRGHENRATSGARVVVQLQDGTTLTRHDRGNDEELQFGVGRRTKLTSVRVYWPSGKLSQLVDSPIDQHLGFIEPTGPETVRLAAPVLGVIRGSGGRTQYCK